jgi:NAD(P)-dependent dehydrogenase (short-subunit alcohol dehydrogenase family)
LYWDTLFDGAKEQAVNISLQSALITGSSRGHGRGIAVKLAKEGVQRIAIHCLTERSEAEMTLALVNQAGAEGVIVQGDVCDAVRAETLVHEAAEQLGGCDIYG